MAGRLLEVFSAEPEKAVYREYEDAPLKEGQIRVQVEYAAAKHGTEFTAFKGDSVHETHNYDEDWQLFLPREGGKKAYSMRPGNMWVGRVSEAAPGVTRVAVGDCVAGYGGIRPTQTANADGVRVLPDGMGWKAAVCYDPLQFALGGVRDGNVRAGDNVAVFGLGAIGQMEVQLAKRAGAMLVIACDPIAKRRAVALKNGADYAFDSVAEDAGYLIKELTGKRGVDVAIESSGFYNALQSAIRGCAYNGNVAVTGWYHECKGGLDLGWEAHFNQPNILISRACSEPNRDYPRWGFQRICDTAWQMLADGWLDCESVVDPVVPFKDAAQAYMDIYRDPSDSVKLGVRFD